MKKHLHLIITITLIALSILYTILVAFVDVAAIGPNGSEVGFSSMNSWFIQNVSYNETFYKISKYSGYACFLIVIGYAAFGIYQAIKRKSLKKVDKEIYALALFYILTGIVYFFFELVVVNFRPILEEGQLAASFPSSHTVLGLCFAGSAIAFNLAKYNNLYTKVLDVVLALIALIVVVSRTLSGVHWLSDIIGGIIISAALLSTYISSLIIIKRYEKRTEEEI